ncbi:MAG: signal peptidase I [Burkholderiales bacterium]
MAEEAIIRRHWWAAGLIGLLAPGLGQLYTGRAGLAGYVMGSFVALFALFHTGMPSTFAGFVFLFGGAMFVSWGGAVEAALNAWRRSSVTRRPYHRWYVYAAYAAAFMIVSQAINLGLLASIGQPSMFGAYRPYSAGSRNMEPGLLDGEYLLAEMHAGATARQLKEWLGSIVFIKWTDDAGIFMFRLIAVEGQTVAVSDRKVLIDGKVLPRKLICSATNTGGGSVASRSIETLAGRGYVVQNFDEHAREADEVTVPAGQFFVMGDARENSYDSRFRGTVPNENYAGRALFILWSKDWSRIGKTLVPGPVDVSDYCPPSAK